MKRFLIVLFLVLFSLTVYADSPLPTPQSPLPTPVSEFPPVPPVDIEEMNEWVAMAGLGAVGLLLIELLKRLGVVPDGQASRWTSVFNIVGFAALTVVGVFGVDVVNNTGIQNVFDILVRVFQATLVVLESPLLFKLVRGLGILPPLSNR